MFDLSPRSARPSSPHTIAIPSPRDRRPADTGRPEIFQRLFIPLISLFLDTLAILFDRRRLADVNGWFHFISTPPFIFIYLLFRFIACAHTVAGVSTRRERVPNK